MYGLKKHFAKNKLRDMDDKYFDEGHIFSLNGEILGSYDVCAGCEAHAMMIGIKASPNTSVAALWTLETIPSSYRDNSLDLVNCPIVHRHL